MTELFNPHILSIGEIFVRLVLAAGLGLVLGLDRELKQKPVGIRGYMLVALGSAGFAILSIELAAAVYESQEGFKIDPSRAIQGLIGGIGFLGAGAIIQREAGVLGMATGASIWLAGAIGMACGYGSYFLAVAMTLIALFILVIIGLLHRRIDESQDG